MPTGSTDGAGAKAAMEQMKRFLGEPGPETQGGLRGVPGGRTPATPSEVFRILAPTTWASGFEDTESESELSRSTGQIRNPPAAITRDLADPSYCTGELEALRRLGLEAPSVPAQP